jgi:tripartite-type tricarboxylate transporter receptor subunit TctC
MLRHIRNLCAAVLAAASLLAVPAQAAFPDRPITLIVPWAAGGGTDAVARQIAMMLERDLKQPVNVVNRIGGSGVVGHSAIAGATPDGYTIGMITLEINMMHWVGLTTLTSDQFTHFALMNTDAAAIHVKSDSPFKTVKELFAHIKANPNKVVASGSGQGGSWHLALAGLMQADGISPQSIRWVPSTGAATALTDLAAGGVEFVSCSMPEAEALIKAGRVRSLTVMSGKRLANYPDVPTVDEATGHKWHKGVWRAMVGPKGMAKEIATQYETLLKKIYDSSEFQEFMAKRGFDMAWMGSAEFAEFLKKDDAEIGTILKSLGLAK